VNKTHAFRASHQANQTVQLPIDPKEQRASIRIWFADQRLTAHGGMMVWSHFLQQKKFREPLRPALPQKGRQRILLQWLQEREIWARVHRPGFRSVRSRLWTSLLEPEAAPALAWVPLHRQRWEQALYDRQRKCQLRKTDVLQSHTLETGAQEIAARALASAPPQRMAKHRCGAWA